ncbi:MAG: S-layer homology domain-containing protein [Eubacteriales bacterium]|nr:S-layer homology domain-containing protein [Eubacteriales bacterium]
MKTKFSMFVVMCLLVTFFTGCLTGFAADMPEVEQMYSYDDVKEGHWAYPWVTYMTNHNYIHGYPADENDGLYLYKPDQFITRGEFVTILYFMLKPQGHMTETFTDINTKYWSYPYVDKAVANGYMSGYGDGTVRPDAFITREEASSIVYRAFKIDKYTEETSFVDSGDISNWAYEAVMSLAQLGVVVGYTGDAENESYIRPGVNIKRAEVAALLANADKFYPESIQFSDNTSSFTVVAGGKLEYDMFPKNTSDTLSISFDIEPDVKYTITYTKDGTEKTVSSEDFAKEVFTSEELGKLNITINVPDAKSGDKVQVKVTVTDTTSGNVVGEKVYDVEFIAQGGSGETTTPIQGGGGSNRTYTVTYMVNGTPTTEQVAHGNKPVNVPVPTSDPTKNYEWTDENGSTVIPSNVIITSDRIFTTDTTIRRDRVVESLQAYQAMLSQGRNVATVSALTGDTVDPAITPGATDGTNWWTNDMLQVIATNDRGYYENDASYGKEDIVLGKALKPIYDDVARYIVDYYSYFSGATVTSLSKFEFVAYYRAMVKTIDAAADEAVKAYVTARKNNADADPNNNQYKDAAFNSFITAATSTGMSSLTTALQAEYPSAPADKKQSLSLFAAAYVTEMVKNMAPAATADDLKLNAGLAQVKTILESIYPTSFDFDDATACATAAEAVKTTIANNAIYAK